jgi:signal transduction histidine kinase
VTRPSARFLSQLAHDLRSPLNVIGSTLTELAQESGLNTADREQIVNLSQRAVGRLMTLADRLGLASRLGQPFDLALERRDLSALSRKTISAFIPEHLRRRIEMTATYADGPIEIVADGALVEVLVLELLSNANRFAKRAVRIDVSIAETAVLTVEDDGEGIREDERATLFEPFADRRSRTGMGMGLWLARRLAELHQGTVVVEHLVTGTRQRLTLPLAQ